MRALSRRIESLEAEVQTSAAVIADLEAGLQRQQNERFNLENRLRHDLRGPLTAILGYTDLLQKGPGELTPKQVRFIENIKAGGTNLLRLISATEDSRTQDSFAGAERTHAKR